MAANLKLFIPREGQSVLDPQTRVIVPPEGKMVSAFDEYWVRRVTDGDGTLADPPADPPDHDE